MSRMYSCRCSCGFESEIHDGPEEYITDYFGCKQCHKISIFSETVAETDLQSAFKKLDAVPKICDTCKVPLVDLELVSAESGGKNFFDKLLKRKTLRYTGRCPKCGADELKFYS